MWALKHIPCKPFAIKSSTPHDQYSNVKKNKHKAIKMSGQPTQSPIIIDNNSGQEFDRFKEAQKFEDSKLGVKGLMDSGITTIPKLFIHQDQQNQNRNPEPKNSNITIPTIDLSEVNSELHRPMIVEQVSHACRTYGFLQIINHGISLEVMNKVVNGLKGFHELPNDVKKHWYQRDMVKGVNFFSNVDLFASKAASWRDTLQVRLGPQMANKEDLPEICRDEIIAWNDHAGKVAELLMELLCEGLGLKSNALKELTCSEARVMAGHYYPYCPQPDLTIGITSHTDPGVLTIVLQDSVGGLQIKHGDEWIDVKPVPGALVINIGDIMQIMSNDEYISVDHRVLANASKDPRISLAIFYNASKRDLPFGPFTNLITAEKPARYKQFMLPDYMRRFFSKELDGKTLTDYYRL